MGLYDKAKELDDRISNSSTAYQLKKILDTLLPLAILAIPVVLYFEFIAATTPTQKLWVIRTEQALLAYFLLELLIDLGIYENNRQFLKDRWIDILLVLPFLTVIRGTAKLLRLFKGFKSLKSLKAAKSAKTSKTIKALKPLKGAQKTGKAIKKGKDILKESKSP